MAEEWEGGQEQDTGQYAGARRFVSLSSTPHPRLERGPDGTYGVWTDDLTPDDQVQQWWTEAQQNTVDTDRRQAGIATQQKAQQRQTRDNFLANGANGVRVTADGAIVDMATGIAFSIDKLPPALAARLAATPQGLDFLTENWQRIPPATMQAIQQVQAGAGAGAPPPGAPGGGGGGGGGSQKTTPPPAADSAPPIKALKDLTFENMTDAERKNYFNWQADPAFASANLLTKMGVDTSGGNPFAASMLEDINQMGQLAKYKMALENQPGTGFDEVGTSLDAVRRRVGVGGASLFDTAGGAEFLRKMAAESALGSSRTGVISPGMTAVLPELEADSAKTRSVFGGVMGGQMGRASRNALNSLLEQWEREWRQQGAPGGGQKGQSLFSLLAKKTGFA